MRKLLEVIKKLALEEIEKQISMPVTIFRFLVGNFEFFSKKSK